MRAPCAYVPSAASCATAEGGCHWALVEGVAFARYTRIQQHQNAAFWRIWQARHRVYRLDEDRKGFQKAKDWMKENWPAIAQMKELVKPLVWIVADSRENKISRSYVNYKFWVTTFSTQFWNRVNCPRLSSQSSSRALSDAPKGAASALANR